jgi:YVTN family beta-propeller protein
VIATVQAELGAGGTAVDMRRQIGYCANFLSESMTVFDCDTLEPIERIELGRAPCALVVNELNDSLYVANSAVDSVMRLDLETRKIVAETPVGRGPVGINNSPSGDRIYVGNRGEGTVSVIGAADDLEWARIPVGEAPAGCVVDPRSGHLLVSNAGTATLTIIEDLLSGPVPGAAARPLHPLIGRRLPDFALWDLHERRMRHSREWSERKYILNFFASW